MTQKTTECDAAGNFPSRHRVASATRASITRIRAHAARSAPPAETARARSSVSDARATEPSSAAEIHGAAFRAAGTDLPQPVLKQIRQQQ